MGGLSRRTLLQTSASAVVSSAALSFGVRDAAAAADVLTIAYPAAPPAFDPNIGPSAVSPGVQSIYRTIYDPYIVQNPDLRLAPGVIEQFAWNEDHSKISLTLRQRRHLAGRRAADDGRRRSGT